ncbi:AdeC/AdeK/OprM family multidrug efflux complex outer membrane factor [Cupriavidus plantarum]|uniref:AdeC/AdeK/OprM family multidrug efflux complex outer membrane factor n=1 Tax=Cupriavidus plantarum TaxID=942865 RepID=UPI001B0F5E37|nr:AdeC/AdeK/OprM family multidrug efflux complex outer membrane factor [Cupriavidus plantarum]CAG2151844.1 Outer membrane protein OprM [Cupriavidus plantarum]SMR85078.1 outer membrane protein, multidrug efflux system [Cupriavidus plantarum]
MRKTLVSLAAGAFLAGCSLIPKYEQPAAPVDAVYPTGDAYPAAGAGNAVNGPSAAELGWRDYFTDPRLQRLIEVALQNNRDLRIAVLNMDAYRAQYRIQRAELFPEVNGSGQYTAQRVLSPLSSSGQGIVGRQFNLALGITAWEIDLFGRLRSLNEAALQTYFSSEEAQRSTHIALVANVANAYLTLRADQEQLKLTRETLGTYERTYNLTRRSFDEGISSRLDLRQAQTSVETARATLARYTRQVAQDVNALSLLIGASVPADLPEGLSLDDKLVADVPAGLPSDLLRNRPDILSAEYQLKAANATIGAARAAFFPSISLTASAGTASRQLSGLFDSGSGTWLFNPQINVPIFTAGSLMASLDYSRIQKDVTVAQYERAIQSAFREVADGLAARGTFSEQLQAQQRLVEASQDYYKLADQRYRTGVDNYLTLLDAQRQLFSAQQTLISDRLNQLTAEVNLYKALGGGWIETTAAPAPAPAAAGTPTVSTPATTATPRS